MTTQLQKKAMLVWFRASEWKGIKSDQQEASNVVRRAGATQGSVRLQKDLGLKGHLRQVSSDTRNIIDQHKKLTLEWDNDWKQRILPVALFERYQNELKHAEIQRTSSIEEFLHHYPAAIEEARDYLGALFDEEDYPMENMIHSKFGIKSSFLPIPDAAHFITDLNPSEQKKVKAQIESYMSNCIRNAISDIYLRISRALEAVINQTKPMLEGQTTRVTNNALDTLHELVDIGPLLNVVDDPTLNRLFKKISKPIDGVTSDMLRPRKAVYDQNIRNKLHLDLSKILQEIRR